MKNRVRGLEAHKQNIMAAKTVAKTLRSSLGPKARARRRRCRRRRALPLRLPSAAPYVCAPRPCASCFRGWTRCCRARTAT